MSKANKVMYSAGLNNVPSFTARYIKGLCTKLMYRYNVYENDLVFDFFKDDVKQGQIRYMLDMDMWLEYAPSFPHNPKPLPTTRGIVLKGIPRPKNLVPNPEVKAEPKVVPIRAVDSERSMTVEPRPMKVSVPNPKALVDYDTMCKMLKSMPGTVARRVGWLEDTYLTWVRDASYPLEVFPPFMLGGISPVEARTGIVKIKGHFEKVFPEGRIVHWRSRNIDETMKDWYVIKDWKLVFPE